MAKGCALSTGYLPRGGLPRNSVDRITDRPDMPSAVDRGRKASTQTNKQKSYKQNFAFCGVPSGAILFADTIFIEKCNKNEKLLPMPLKMKVDSSN